jgi:hypothetical protein
MSFESPKMLQHGGGGMHIIRHSLHVDEHT